MHAENLGRILLDKTRNSGAENYGILIRLSADWMGKVDYESEIFLIQRYITLWKGTTASVDIISLSSKLFHDSCFKPAERRKYFFRYSLYVGENSFDLKQVAIISAETYQMVLNLILASICIEKILVIPVTWQISAQPQVIVQLPGFKRLIAFMPLKKNDLKSQRMMCSMWNQCWCISQLVQIGWSWKDIGGRGSYGFP